MRRQSLEAVLLLAPAVIFLLWWFIVPLVDFLWLAVSGDAKTPTPFAELVGSQTYQRVFVATLLVAAMVMVITVLLAYPLAYALCRLKGFWFIVALYGVLFPLWISTLVRTFSWMLLLERNGPINRALVGAGLTDKPFVLLFNDTAVTIGMVHVLLPYAVLPLYSAMSRIDRRLLLASDGLGASPLTTFWRVYLPLSMPGLIGGAGFVFLFALGFYITPAILGGANAITLSMLIAGFVSERLDWPLAAAASVLLLGVVLALLAVGARLVPLQHGALGR